MRTIKKPTFILSLLIVLGTLVFPQALADSPWPKYTGPDNHNTGRSPFIGPETPDIKWVLDLGGFSYFRNLSCDIRGTIYVGSASELFAINPEGTIKWSIPLPLAPTHVTVSEDGFLYIQSILDKMYKVRLDIGELINDHWPYDFSAFNAMGIYPATIAGDGTILCGNGGSGTRYLHAINPDGTDRWRVAFGDNVETLPAVDDQNRVVYCGSNKNQITKINLEDGQVIKQVSPGGHGYILSHIAIGDNGFIYFSKFSDQGDGKGHLFAYDQDLNKIWEVASGTYWMIPPALGQDGTIYTSGRSTGKISALDPITGVEKWFFLIDGDMNTPPVIDDNGTIYVVTKNHLYSIAPDGTGAQLKWTFQLDGSGYAQPMISEDGTLYILSRNGLLTALGKSIKDISIDIKPGSTTNPINLKSRGNVTVAIFGTTGFNVATIDPSTLTLAGALVKVKKNGNLMFSFEDVNYDGIADMVVHFETASLELTLTDTEAILEGETYSGTSIRGVDAVTIITN